MIEPDVVLSAADSRTFVPWGTDAEISLLRVHSNGGVTTLTRFMAGAHGAWHTHPAGEELYVVSGRVQIGGRELVAGDYLYTPAGAGHDVHAIEETLLFIVLPEAPVYGGAG
jgi:quercetin dioxygenase-like cupin family protein